MDRGVGREVSGQEVVYGTWTVARDGVDGRVRSERYDLR